MRNAGANLYDAGCPLYISGIVALLPDGFLCALDHFALILGFRAPAGSTAGATIPGKICSGWRLFFSAIAGSGTGDGDSDCGPFVYRCTDRAGTAACELQSLYQPAYRSPVPPALSRL